MKHIAMIPEQPEKIDRQRRSLLKLSGLLGFGAAVAAVLPARSANAVLFGRHEYSVSETRLAMGSFVAITAIHESRDQAQQAIGLAFAEIDRLAGLLSRHDAATPVSYLNSTGALRGAPPEVLEVVARALVLHRETNGAFDITVKPLLDLYQARFAAGNPPTEAEIGALLPRIGAEHLRFAGGDISFGRPGMGITLDGIAPGYIVDRASEVMAANGVSNHLVNASGDIRVSGLAAKGRPWTVAVQDPEKRRDYPDVVRLTSGAISTSGDYEIYYDRERLYHHIVNSRTGHSPVMATSVTVTAATVMDADALATGLFVMGPEDGIRLMADRLSGCAALFVKADGELARSRNWPAAV